MCDNCGMYNQRGPYAYRDGKVPRVQRASKDPTQLEPKWLKDCDRCLWNVTILCHMFRWRYMVSSVWPYRETRHSHI